MGPETSTTLHRLSALGKRRVKDQTGKQGKLVPNQGPRMTTHYLYYLENGLNPPKTLLTYNIARGGGGSGSPT